jgi:hypothetical protein
MKEKDVLVALIESYASTALALQAVADTVSALKTVVGAIDPKMAAELQRQIHLENKKSQAHASTVQRQLEALRAVLQEGAN